jgi:hypothetical protein
VILTGDEELDEVAELLEGATSKLRRPEEADGRPTLDTITSVDGITNLILTSDN